jgi:hypothetical protein
VLFRSSLASLAGSSSLPLSIHLKLARYPAERVDRELSLSVQADQADDTPENNTAFRSFVIQRSFDYANDFSSGADTHWSNQQVTQGPHGLSYLGAFSNDSITLTFNNLPPHDWADLCFDLYVLGPWDGSHFTDPQDTAPNPQVIGPDLWSSYINEDPLLVTTFSNQARLTQSYPFNYRDGEAPAQTGAVETGGFGGPQGTQDSRYHLCYQRGTTAANFKATFYGLNLDNLGSETWALDNVKLKIYYYAAYDRLYFPAVAR